MDRQLAGKRSRQDGPNSVQPVVSNKAREPRFCKISSASCWFQPKCAACICNPGTELDILATRQLFVKHADAAEYVVAPATVENGVDLKGFTGLPLVTCMRSEL